MRKILVLLGLFVLFSCSWVETSDDHNISRDFKEEIAALNQTQAILSHVTSITKIVFGFVINEIGIFTDFHGEEIEIRQTLCPSTSKEVDLIREELAQFGTSTFDLIFTQDCDIEGRSVPFEGLLNIRLTGDIDTPEGEMYVKIVNGFKVIEDEDRSIEYFGGNMNYLYTKTQDSRLFFDTQVDSLKAEENSPVEELVFNLVNLENAISIVDIGEIETDIENPITFLDDTAEIRFTGGLLKRSSTDGSERADAHFNKSNLIFDLFCGCPIDGRLSLDISITEFIVDYSTKINDCDESPLNTIISDGQIIIDAEPLVDTFLPCDGF